LGWSAPTPPVLAGGRMAHTPALRGIEQSELAALLEAGAPAISVTPVRESLERYFLDKTEGVIG